jgi:hypothetical protein
MGFISAANYIYFARYVVSAEGDYTGWSYSKTIVLLVI